MTEVERLRLFVAVTVPGDRLRGVLECVDPHRDDFPRGRWLPQENLHATLKFLGSTPSDRLGEIAGVCGTVARSHEPAEVRLTKMGAFPSARRARVLWVGFDDPAGVLSRLAEDLSRAFEPLGFEPEKRSFTPHLTLARFKAPGPLPASLPELPESCRRPFAVDAVELLRSRLHPSGARYESLERFPLGRR